MEYESVIGLETHVQLKTRSKMWCGCANDFGAIPNSNTCPVCLGFPGVLPVANKEAVRLTALTGLLLNCDVPKFAKWDRKNYFYPDSPKNYQITQLDFPSTISGYVEFELDGKMLQVRITRAHLEEDVGKSFHYDEFSGLDFNRAGVPLLEIVSEPALSSAEMAYEYLNALKRILQYGRVSDCDMEKGQVRCDVNVSVRLVGAAELGAKIEIKNMNSFRGVRRALQHEIPRQIDILKKGGDLVQETRRWDDAAGVTDSMRVKEDAHDYRYIPDPDLMPHEPSEQWLSDIKECVVELPLERKQRLMANYKLPEADASVFVADPKLGDYFEEAVESTTNYKAVANLIINNLQSKLTESGAVLADLKFPSSALPELVGFVEDGKISSKMAQEIFNEMFSAGSLPGEIIEEKGFKQLSDSNELEKYCGIAIDENPGPAEDYRNGKEAALNYLKGQVMMMSKGKANPKVVGDLLKNILSD